MITDYRGFLKTCKATEKKPIKKLGTIRVGIVESTPIVWKNELLLFEWLRPAHSGTGRFFEERTEGYFHFANMETDEEVGKPFAFSHSYGCAYEENGTMYGFGSAAADGEATSISVFWSNDLENWESKTAVELPEGLTSYNTSVCKDDKGYVMAIEVYGPKDIIGNYFTVIFARSENLLDWELMPIDKHIYTKERYSACPTIRYYDGYYYIVYLEIMPYFRLVPYIVRTKDIETFEPGHVLPVLMYDDDDRKVIHPERFTAEELEYIKTAVDINNSDVDFCNYNGKTVISYSWGNQMGTEFLALAEYDGTEQEFLESFFKYTL